MKRTEILISVHVPKAGGTAFGYFLQSHFGDRLLVDYSDHPMRHGTLPRTLITLRGMLKTKGISRKYDCIHGHFLPFKYRFVENKSLCIWLRDPAERAVSRYYQMMRKIDSVMKSDPTMRFDLTMRSTLPVQYRRHIRRADISLAEFCRIRHYHNLYRKYLWGMRIEDFDFVGIVEDHENSMKVFSRKFNIPLPSMTLPNPNPNPQRTGARYEIPEELRRLICNANGKDCEIYKKALLINRNLQKEYLDRPNCRKQLVSERHPTSCILW